jgi:hypothetical protein
MNMVSRTLSRLGAAASVIVLAVVPSLGQTDAGEILDRAIGKLGGEAFLAATDVLSTGRYYQFQRGELAGGDVFRDYVKFPDKERTEFGEKRERVRINNGDRGWNIVDEVVEAQIPEQIELFWEEFKVGLDYLLRVVLPESQATLQYVGRDMIDFRRVDILEIRDEDRTRINLYVDRSDGLLLKKSVRRLNSPQVHEEVYSNYHEFHGVLTPLLVTRYTGGIKTMEIRFETVTYNSDLSDDLFLADVAEDN